jgi:hypothetical protein
VDLSVPVYMSWGKWVAQCPRPGCHNAEQLGQCDDGTVGGLTATSFVCRESHLGCGVRCAADWPDRVKEIEFMLRSRPVGARNWFPGETVDDLFRENIENGLIPKNAMNIIDGRIEILAEIESPESRLMLPGGYQ